MSTPLRVAAFAALLVAVFVAALGLGRLVGPLDVAVAEGHDDGGHDDGGHDDPAEAVGVGGLQTSESGYALALAGSRLAPGARTLELTVTGPDGHPVTAYDVAHGKRLHLIVVRRDLTGFQHVHPTLDETTGVWSVDVRLDPGPWRVIADFAPTGGAALALGTDLLVSGRPALARTGPERRTATVGDYEVTLDGDLTASAESTVTLTVTRAGRPVADLQPYLGAYGHLVALRDGDLAYLHVHPDGEPGEVAPGPDVVFHAEVPSAGAYRLFLDFRHDGVVRTADFTVHVDDGTGGASHDD